MTQRIEPFLFSNMTQRIELFFWIWHNELNFLEHDSKNCFFECDSKNRTFEFFFLTTQRIELFSKIRHKELNLFQYDSKTFPIRLKEINLFSNMTQRIEPFFLWYDLKNWFFFFQKMTQISKLFSMTQKNWTFFLHDLFFFKKYNSKNWAL